ncbi:ArnT family glycosyltransferase [Neptunomonas japonica]|uniref:Glycosyl transferase family 39 n=1 Tax=Neptunomonas japonica JAMM 1380 TaxID=1441457 RepID=A0A7R6SUV1_9GAMM|nr:glycosyltransferase family 39 protein [Neptunomonas japonica]BBB28037.1 glycosyl transferase family 39 [Neptunomonas japonica JAMM 1380]
MGSAAVLDREKHHLFILLGLVFVYFLGNQVAQFVFSGTADLDQAEQLIVSQDFKLGYSAQPPLYTWIVQLLFSITGPSLVLLLVLKSIILSMLAVSIVFIGRLFSFTTQQQVIAVISIAFIPQVIWESQRDLTHSPLATAMAAVTLLQVVILQRVPSVVNYIVAGCLVGLGLLSKYNYFIFLMALTFAVLLTPQYRFVLLNKRVLFAFIPVFLIISPHYYWVLNHLDIVSGSVHKLQSEGGGFFSGIGHALLSALAFLSPLWLFSLVLLGRKNSASNVEIPDKKMLINLLVLELVFVAIFVWLTGAQEIKDRWFQPLLFFIPLAIAAFYKPSRRGFKIFCLLGVIFAVLVSVALSARIILFDDVKRSSRPNVPYESINQSLSSSLGSPTVIFAESRLIGGNARNYFKKARVITPEYAEGFRKEESSLGAKSKLVAVLLCESLECNKDGFSELMKHKFNVDIASLELHAIERNYYFSDVKKHTLYWTRVAPVLQ